MKMIYSAAGNCEKARQYLDYYVSGELSIGVTLDVSRHLKSCKGCADEREARSRLRDRLRHAVRQTPVSPDLRAKVVKRIGQSTGQISNSFWAKRSRVRTSNPD